MGVSPIKAGGLTQTPRIKLNQRWGDREKGCRVKIDRRADFCKKQRGNVILKALPPSLVREPENSIAER